MRRADPSTKDRAAGAKTFCDAVCGTGEDRARSTGHCGTERPRREPRDAAISRFGWSTKRQEWTELSSKDGQA